MFLLAHYCTRLFKNDLYYVGGRSADAIHPAFSLTPSDCLSAWSHQQRVNEAGRTEPGWKWTSPPHPPAFSCLLHSFEVCLKSMSTLKKNHEVVFCFQRKGLMKFWCKSLRCMLENWLHLCSAKCSDDVSPIFFYLAPELFYCHPTIHWLTFHYYLPASGIIRSAETRRTLLVTTSYTFFPLIKFQFK